MARPRFHLLAAAPAAWLAHRRWGPVAAAGLVATGVFVDLDHLLDYLWTRWRGEKTHYLAPLHGWELAVALAALGLWYREVHRQHAQLPDRLIAAPHVTPPPAPGAWRAALAGGLAAGLLLHLVHDVATNRPRSPLVYALAYRLRHGFRREITGWSTATRFHDWSNKPWYTWF
jgi:hypothetical protein